MKRNCPTLVVDTGANTIKFGWAIETADKSSTAPYREPMKVIPNFLAKSKNERRRPYISSQISECGDSSGLYLILPFQKGYMCNPDIQKTIWDYAFSPPCYDVHPNDANIVFMEPMLNFPSIQEATCEILFEEYGFNGVCRTTAPHMVDYFHGKLGSAINSGCTIVVDSGHSSTYVVPFVNGQKVTDCIRRIDVGGKVLTNHLKEIVSYRQLHVLDEFYLMNQVKEDLCYVSCNYAKDVETSRKRFPANTVVREYVLPNYTTTKRGIVRPVEEIGVRLTNDDQLLRLNTERYSVPELLFHPSDVGLNQMGVSETIMSVINGFPESMQPHFYNNILLCGGNVAIPGFRDRVYADIRSETLNFYDVTVNGDSDPVTLAWRGGSAFANDPEFPKFMVSRNQYREYGVAAFEKKSDIT